MEVTHSVERKQTKAKITNSTSHTHYQTTSSAKLETLPYAWYFWRTFNLAI